MNDSNLNNSNLDNSTSGENTNSRNNNNNININNSNNNNANDFNSILNENDNDNTSVQVQVRNRLQQIGNNIRNNQSHSNNDTAGVRPNRFFNIYDIFSRLDPGIYNAFAHQAFTNTISSRSNNNSRMNIDSINMNNEENNNQENLIQEVRSNNYNNENITFRNVIAATPNIIAPIKFSKFNSNDESEQTYNFSNAAALFSTSESLFLINKGGEIFTINEKTGEITLEGRHFPKNIECFAVNSTHIYFYNTESKWIFRAAIIKNNNKNCESDFANLNASNMEITKKILSDKERDFLGGSRKHCLEQFSLSPESTGLNYYINQKNFPLDLQNKILLSHNLNNNTSNPHLRDSSNIHVYVCSHCQNCIVSNKEEVKKYEVTLTKALDKEQDESRNENRLTSSSCNEGNISLNINPKNMKNFVNKDKKAELNLNLNLTKFEEKELDIANNTTANHNYNNNNTINKISKISPKAVVDNHSNSANIFNIELVPCKKSLFSKVSDFCFEYLKIEKFYELDCSIVPTRLICDEKKLLVIDKTGELNKIDIEYKAHKKFQCLFMLRNCHINNSVLMGDGDLILLDPVRLSLNKLNIITGTEIIILHSVKFLASIKYVFTNNSKIYFIDVAGNLYNFNEYDKKIIQIGNNGLCKYIIDFAVHKNFLFTIENNSLLYRTNLSDGVYKEIRNDCVKNYSHFMSDNSNLVFITKDDFVNILALKGEELLLKRKFKLDNISKYRAITMFKKQIIYYNPQSKTIEAINLADEDVQPKVLVDNFVEVLLFINNNDCLACIIKDSVIYKLYC